MILPLYTSRQRMPSLLHVKFHWSSPSSGPSVSYAFFQYREFTCLVVLVRRRHKREHKKYEPSKSNQPTINEDLQSVCCLPNAALFAFFSCLSNDKIESPWRPVLHSSTIFSHTFIYIIWTLQLYYNEILYCCFSPLPCWFFGWVYFAIINKVCYVQGR